MKHLKTFENSENQDNISKLENDLLNILDGELYTEDYYDMHYVSDASKKDAVKEIITYLTKLGINFDQYFDAKKFNI